MPFNLGPLELLILLFPVILGIGGTLIMIGARRRSDRNPSHSRKSSPARPRYAPPPDPPKP